MCNVRHYRHWTPEEDAELLASVGVKRLTTTARRLGRTVDAARRRVTHVLGLNHQREARRTAGMSIQDVCVALGVDSQRVCSWIKKGWLLSHLAYGVSASYQSIDAYELSSFLSERGALLPYLQPCDLAWSEEVAQARAGLEARYIASPALRSMLLWSRGTLAHVQREHGFGGIPFITIGASYPYYYDRAGVKHWLLKHPRYMTTAAREAFGL